MAALIVGGTVRGNTISLIKTVAEFTEIRNSLSTAANDVQRSEITARTKTMQERRGGSGAGGEGNGFH